MFIAMNRFRVKKGQEENFEEAWRQRESHLKDVPGFEEFHLLRGPEKEEYTLFASHTVWRTREDFKNWTESEAFKKAHANAGQTRDFYVGGPEFEGFDVVLTME
jgi:heme-degrading monooxygenase HmoA